MKIAKRMAAIGAAMVMAVSMMSTGASAATYLNWSVTNVNRKTLYNETLYANGYAQYNVSCTSFIGQNASNTYVKHYPYMERKRNGVISNTMCAPAVDYYSTLSETKRNYTTSLIPPYGQKVHYVFRLYQPSSTTVYKKASGLVKLVAGY